MHIVGGTMDISPKNYNDEEEIIFAAGALGVGTFRQEAAFREGIEAYDRGNIVKPAQDRWRRNQISSDECLC